MVYRDHAGDHRRGRRAPSFEAILGFRYWLDEPGNDVMWYWSENHVLCFHRRIHRRAPFPTMSLEPGRTGREQGSG